MSFGDGQDTQNTRTARSTPGSVPAAPAGRASSFVVNRDLPLTRELYRRWDDESGGPADGQVLDAHFVHLPGSTDRIGGVWCEAAIEGVVLADTGGRVSRALRDVRRAIGEGRLVRRRAHGQPYWTAA